MSVQKPKIRNTKKHEKGTMKEFLDEINIMCIMNYFI